MSFLNSLQLERLSSFQRKLVYLSGIVVLMVGAIILGAPSTSSEPNDESGGVLPRMRHTHALGQSTLGQVDPSSQTMNLVLLGLKGIAANVLWMEHEEFKRTKNWARMEDTVQSIITLQPHFLQVWRYHGWDLAFNVSSQWDDVRDRFFWVKKGTKFTMEGTKKNDTYAELPWDVGRLVGHKIGRSDEWRQFRVYFMKDPAPLSSWGNKKADPDINPEEIDNYLVAYDWFQKANITEAERYKESPNKKGQKQMMRELFRHYPARSMFDWADALHRSGTFGETSATAWDRARDEWVKVYGREHYDSRDGAGVYWLEPHPGELEVMVKLDIAEMKKHDPTLSDPTADQMKQLILQKRKLINARQDVTNYRYWRARGNIEADPKMNKAHREMYEGRQLYNKGKTSWNPDGTPPLCVKKLEDGLRGLETVFAEFDSIKAQQEEANATGEERKAIDDPTQDENLLEEAIIALMYYREAHRMGRKEIPEDYPMKKLWDKYQTQEQAAFLEKMEKEFKRDISGR